ncbi:MAG: DUF502 domain-containing protein [Paracoccaceae bacterium]
MARKTKKPARKIAPKPSLFQRMRVDFFTGLIIVAPVVITIYLIWTAITFIDAKVVPWVPAFYNPSTYIGQDIPGFGVIIFLLFTAIIGALTKGLFGRQLVRFWENLIGRTPIVRSVYGGLKQIVETILSQSNASFQKACLVEYPRKGIWAIAFISTDTRGEVQNLIADHDLYSIFLPTTPNPTSGFLLFVPKKEVVVLDMSVEDAAKLVISAGLVVPPTAEEIAAGVKAVPAKQK